MKFVLALALACSSASIARAATGGAPLAVTHQGWLLDSTDTPVSTSLTLKFRVFDAVAAGTLEWEGTCADVTVLAGYYAVVLGGATCTGTGGAGDSVLDTSDLPPGVTRWLELVIGSTTMQPRLVVATVPTAAIAGRALDADKLGGHPPTHYATANHGHAASELTGLAPVATSGAWADLSGRPTYATVATSGSYADLTNKPSFAPVATSGSYADLSNAPVLKPVATTGAYDDLTGRPVLAAVATSGAYGDLSGKPSSFPADPGSLVGTTVPGTLNATLFAGGVKLANVTTCNAAAAGTLRWTGTAFEGCDGSAWMSLATLGNSTLGTSTNPATNCLAIRQGNIIAGNGNYWLDPDGTGGAAPFQTYCDMVTDGGGWTLVMKLAGDTTLSWVAAQWTTTALLNDSDLDFTTDTNAKYPSFNTVAGNSLMYYRYGAPGSFMRYDFAASVAPLARFQSGSAHSSTSGGWRPTESHNNTSNSACNSYTSQGRGVNYQQLCDGNSNFTRARLGEGYEQTGIAHCVWGVGTYNSPCAAPTTGYGSPGGRVRLFVR